MKSVTRWDPVSDIVSLRQAMDRLFEESFVRPSWTETTRALRPPVNVYMTDDDIVINVAIPGASADDVDVSIEGDTVTIRGELKSPLENVEYLVQEMASGPFRRVITVNVPIQPDKAEASFRDGILTLTIPKAEEVKPRVIKVQQSK